MTSKCFYIVYVYETYKEEIKAVVSVVPVVVLDVLVAVADLSGGGVGEVGPGVAVEDLMLELGLGLPQPRDVVMKLGQLWIQRPLLRGELNLGIRHNKIREEQKYFVFCED